MVWRTFHAETEKWIAENETDEIVYGEVAGEVDCVAESAMLCAADRIDNVHLVDIPDIPFCAYLIEIESVKAYASSDAEQVQVHHEMEGVPANRHNETRRTFVVAVAVAVVEPPHKLLVPGRACGVSLLRPAVASAPPCVPVVCADAPSPADDAARPPVVEAAPAAVVGPAAHGASKGSSTSH